LGIFVDYKNPKPIDKELTELEEGFIDALVDGKMSAHDAFIHAGYSKTKAGPRALRLQRHLWLHIERRIKDRVSETATLALNVLEQLMQTADSENVRLNAARDILSRAGYDAVQRQERVIKDATELTDEELEKQLSELLKDEKVVKFANSKQSS